eukprot:COSAG06_NODE_51415_length_312_cov_0.962441_1_plen_32_part_10
MYIVAYLPVDYKTSPTQKDIWDALAQHINQQP